MGKFKNKYRIPSSRAQWWDYSNIGAYFITICTAQRQHFFGKIVKKIADPNALQPQFIATLQGTELGKLAEKYWYEIPDQFNFVELGSFVVMPNHIHGILVVTHDTDVDESSTPTPKTGGITGHKNPMLNENIARIIRWYKGRCTFEMRQINTDFKWQSRFHDHIIRTDEEYLRIHHYIQQNPDNWDTDRFYQTEA